jgi:hypothetical protein
MSVTAGTSDTMRVGGAAASRAAGGDPPRANRGAEESEREGDGERQAKVTAASDPAITAVATREPARCRLARRSVRSKGEAVSEPVALDGDRPAAAGTTRRSARTLTSNAMLSGG